jgi:hypothetical protein
MPLPRPSLLLCLVAVIFLFTASDTAVAEILRPNGAVSNDWHKTSITGATGNSPNWHYVDDAVSVDDPQPPVTTGDYLDSTDKGQISRMEIADPPGNPSGEANAYVYARTGTSNDTRIRFQVIQSGVPVATHVIPAGSGSHWAGPLTLDDPSTKVAADSLRLKFTSLANQNGNGCGCHAKVYAAYLDYNADPEPTPTFVDEFTGSANSSPDTSKWAENATQYYGPEAGTGVRSCWGTGPNYARLDGTGALELRALNVSSTCQDPSGTSSTRPYTAGAITTKLQTPILFRAGQRLEARIKVPGGSGVWPAFWLLDPDSGQRSEIDIFEYWGNSPPYVWGSLHGRSDPNGPDGGTGTASRGVKWDTGSNLSNDYHVYGVMWDEDEISFTFDGVPYRPGPDQIPPITIPEFTGPPTGPDIFDPNDPSLNGVWEFDSQELYLILNLAVGDSQPCNNQPTYPQTTPQSCSAPPGFSAATFPATMKVDWVKVWGPVS